MKILNNDIKELDAWILRGVHTLGHNPIIDNIVDEAIDYLKTKYKKNIYELDDWGDKSIIFFNTLNEQDYIEFFQYTKELYIKKFGEEKGLVFYIKFTFGLMEDGEHYSDVINGSKIINESLLCDYKKGFQYYAKKHKYEIGKLIFRVSRNLGKTINGLSTSDPYDFWETYKPE